jgi:hypothetical protein
LEAPLRALGEWASAWIEPAPEPMSKAVSR